MVGRLIQDQQVKFPAEGTGYFRRFASPPDRVEYLKAQSSAMPRVRLIGYGPFRPVVGEIVEVTRLFGDVLGAVFADQALGFGLIRPLVGDRYPRRSRARVVLPQPLSSSRAVQPRSRIAGKCSKMSYGLSG